MKILISGAGIAGLTLAYWLKQFGWTPTVIEKHHSLKRGGYKVEVRGAALKVAKKMDIYQALIEAQINLERAKLVTYPDLKVFVFERDVLGHVVSEEDITINRWDLSQIIARSVGEVEIVYGDSITRLNDRMVYFEKMEPREFDLVIGADGLRSVVRRLVFGEDTLCVKESGIHFCVFPLPNLFELEQGEIVYFDQGKLATAYTVDQNLLAYLQFTAEKPLPYEICGDLKAVFETAFKNVGWEIPRLIAAMKESSDCYFDSFAQVRMPHWSKGRVALVGDAAHAAPGMGTSLAMVGAYILATEIKQSNGNWESAFTEYEKRMKAFVKKGQGLAQSNARMMGKGTSSWPIRFQLYLMKKWPSLFFPLVTKLKRWQWNTTASAIELP